MELLIQNLIKEKLNLLLDHIIKNYPNVDKDNVNYKINSILDLKQQNNTMIHTSFKKQNILDIIKSKKLVINVVKSPFSNYILDNVSFDDIKNAKLIMDLTTKEVIGFENSKGEIEPLNKNLIDICHKYKIKYLIPLNLNIDSESDGDDDLISSVDTNSVDQDLKLYLQSDEDNDE